MKIAKYIFSALAAAMFCAACTDDIKPLPKPDEISITPKTSNISSKGGEASVLVTSSGEWTLSDSDNKDAGKFVTTSAKTGTDGDIVKFTVKANDTEEDRTFKYTFACGIAETTYTVVLKGKASQTEPQLELTYAPESNVIPLTGGSVSVLVTSSGEWTLDGTSEYAQPSVTSGGDGDEVVFTVKENDTKDDILIQYTFKMGGLETQFRITLKAGEIVNYTLAIAGEKSLGLNYTVHKRVEVKLNTNIPYRDITAEIISEEEGWLTSILMQGNNENEVIVYFDLSQNNKFEAREASVIISGYGLEDNLTIKQFPESKIQVGTAAFDLKADASSVEVPVETNVNYAVTFSGNEETWITCDDTDKSKLKFNYAALPEGAMRSCTATLTEINPPEGMDAVVTVLTFVQEVKGIITTAPRLERSHALVTWKEGTPVNAMTAFTLEALICPDIRVGTEQYVIGCDAFRIQIGGYDYDFPDEQLQVIWNDGAVELTNESLKLAKNEWVHIAVTFGEDMVKIYFDGVEKCAGAAKGLTEVDFSEDFYIGYETAVTARYHGMISEVRVWNRALSSDELAAKARRYSLDPESEGLVSYWKFNEGAGLVIKDHASYSNDLTFEGKYGLVWNAVSLPE